MFWSNLSLGGMTLTNSEVLGRSYMKVYIIRLHCVNQGYGQLLSIPVLWRFIHSKLTTRRAASNGGLMIYNKLNQTKKDLAVESGIDKNTKRLPKDNMWVSKRI